VVDVQRLMAHAVRFEQRLEQWSDHIDAGWRIGPLGRCLDAVAGASVAVRRRTAVAVFQRWCGVLPQPEALVHCGQSMALCDRDELLARLCSLALSLRPGVLRCCVDGRVRDLMRLALGDTFDQLRDRVQGGRPVSAPVARREPIAWACVGYRDLVRAGLMPRGSLRRCTRLSLPRRWPLSLRGAHAPALAPALPRERVADAMARVVELRGGAPW
jgi:Bacterial type III secretion protein (HrpB4)